MIRLFDNYAITNDTECYTLQKIGINKKGEEYASNLGYYSTLDKALIACKKDMVRRELASARNISLEDAIATIVRSNNRFEALLKRCFGGVTN